MGEKKETESERERERECVDSVVNECHLLKDGFRRCKSCVDVRVASVRRSSQKQTRGRERERDGDGGREIGGRERD